MGVGNLLSKNKFDPMVNESDIVVRWNNLKDWLIAPNNVEIWNLDMSTISRPESPPQGQPLGLTLGVTNHMLISKA